MTTPDISPILDPDARDLEGKVALITGASRGIGRAIALRLARAGAHVAVLAKTADPHPHLPGTIYETVAAIEALGGKGLPLQVDVRDEHRMAEAVEATVSHFGRLDIAIHNAGVLWWKPIAETSVSRYDLLQGVNARGAYVLAHAALPHLKAAGGGHFVTMSPPLMPEVLPGKVAYLISKFGMTLVAMGLAEEHAADGVAAHALWPETAIESAATVHFKLGDPSLWYKADLMADATYAVVRRDPWAAPLGGGVGVHGRALLAMETLQAAGIEDFVPYRCDPEHEPPALIANRIPRVGGREDAGGKVHQER